VDPQQHLSLISPGDDRIRTYSRPEEEQLARNLHGRSPLKYTAAHIARENLIASFYANSTVGFFPKFGTVQGSIGSAISARNIWFLDPTDRYTATRSRAS
jgi:hypothetical protein